MTRNEREQALWHDAYMLAMSQDPSPAESSNYADAAVAEFRKRYPAEPTAPEAAWYDEPPFAKDGEVHYCWVVGCSDPQSVFWSTGRHEWNHFFACNTAIHRLAGRRVCPIVKPPEPPQ